MITLALAVNLQGFRSLRRLLAADLELPVYQARLNIRVDTTLFGHALSTLSHYLAFRAYPVVLADQDGQGGQANSNLNAD